MVRNPIFDHLVGENDSDLEALTAYALYKKHKRHWARNVEKTTGRLPTAAQDRDFFTAVATSDQLDRYRKDAQDILLAYANQMIVGARPQIEREAVEGRIDAAAKKIEQSGSFLSAIKAGVVSTLINTAILILLAVGIRLIGIDLLSVYTSLGGPPQAEQGVGE